MTKNVWCETELDLIRYLRLSVPPVAVKSIVSVDELDLIPGIRRPKTKQTADQFVGMAARLGWTVGFTSGDLVSTQCAVIFGLATATESWLAGEKYVGVWHKSVADASARQAALANHCAPPNGAIALSPLSSGAINDPDIVLVYGSPGQIILMINGLQWENYKKFDWSVSGESSCADSWGRALRTGEPSLSIPCYAERRYGGVQDHELLLAIQPDALKRCIKGLKRLSGAGIRYPIPSYSIQADPATGLSRSYK